MPRSRAAGTPVPASISAPERLRSGTGAAEHILVEAGETLPVARDQIGVNVTRAADAHSDSFGSWG